VPSSDQAEPPPEYDFILPDQAGTGWVYGIDVSHHNPAPDWTRVAASKVSFVYVKVTQGLSYYDPKFADNWDGLKQQAQAAAADPAGKPLLRGAYHFFSAEGDAGLQAVNFLRRAGIYGARDPHALHDLPPCLDLEWDITQDANGDDIDRWDDFSGDEIIERVKLWVAVVEAETGVKPIIYSNKSWWVEHELDQSAAAQLNGIRIWVADYGRSPAENETPRTVPGLTNSLWQFSEKAAVTGAGTVDVNVYVGTPAQFDAEFGQGVGAKTAETTTPSTP
jgi:lysozyme